MLFDLAADFEQYPCYLPGWRAAWIVSREVERLQAEQTIGVGPMRLQFRTEAALRRPQWIEVTSDDPQFKCFELKWTFQGVGERSCRVGLSVDIELRSVMLRRAVESFGSGSTNVILGAFAKRADQLFGASPDQRAT